ncbi:hypothetical protein IC006_1446 [Sulfuracidifex tepidarius]|uniref:Uncharacterized protein n=1 Tax=Sulfuracidifex tepidarius TaxID=1294262 RepID=A0A510DV90_9CREN|nr:hypothetical protein [Sulfuracidifex tepidarius]BBG24143.1 hypothetical protein IC006_1446 [Sulfuracidifex tepidarius]
MKICSQGILQGGQTYKENPPLFVLKEGDRKIVKGKGFEVTVEPGLDTESLKSLFSALYEGKVGNHTVYLNGYLMMYVPAYGFGSFRVIRSEGEVNQSLNSLFHKLISGEIDDLDYDKELYNTGVSIEGHTVALFEESSIESGEVTWEEVLKGMGFEPRVEGECVDEDISVELEKGNISAIPLMIPIMRRADNVKLSSYITIADVIKGRFVGNMVLEKGVISTYRNFSIDELEKGNLTKTRICGRLRLDSEKPCFYTNSVSAYSEDEKELQLAVERMKELMRKGRTVNF